MPLEVALDYDPAGIQTDLQPWLARDFGVKAPQP
jgi:hypothetical protein